MRGVALADARTPEGMRVYAIGDVHGRLDLLSELLDRIGEELAAQPPADWRIVLLGDHVDRGPDSSGVLDRIAAAQARDGRVLALMGNHDKGFLDFLAEPDATGVFARFGGVETARSYGVELRWHDAQALRAAHAALARAVPRAHLDVLTGLKRGVSLGDYFFCHAGIRPGVALEAQDPDDLIWIRDDFLDWTGLHPKVIVHGHTPGRAAEIRDNRVNVDTGAFHTGVLTAFVAENGEKRLIAAERRR